MAKFDPETEVPSAQAAELLNVSAGFVEQLIVQGELTQAGTPAAIRLAELLEYKKRSDAEAQAALDELTAQAQALQMGYE